MISAETIVAYVDGELDAAGRAEVETAAANDADVAAQIAAHRTLRADLMAAFAPIAQEPVPERLTKAAQGTQTPTTAQVIAFRPRISRPLLLQIGAMAASLIIGIGATLMVTQAPKGDFASRSGGLVARGELAKALSTQLASEEAGGDAPRIGVTFRDQSHAVCRTFTTATNEGLACRDGKDWRVDIASRVTATSDYRQAGSSLVMQAVDARLDGDVFDAAAERSARDGGWRSR